MDATFLLLGDPQMTSVPSTLAGRRDDASALNAWLNGINGEAWPKTPFIDPSLADQDIGPIDATFIAGDLCQTGGAYSAYDQISHVPAVQFGGVEQKLVRALFQVDLDSYGRDASTDWADVPEDLVCLQGPVYFGLGNHDTQTAYHPAAGWWKNGHFSTPENFWRYQMWNFVAQMHAGISTNGKRTPLWPVQAIDVTDGAGFNWQHYSLNYRVDLGPATIFHVHVYGGDATDRRADGISWLLDQIGQLPPQRPIFIVQHDIFVTSEIAQMQDVSWTVAQRDVFLEQLASANVVGFLVGHVHEVYVGDAPQVVDRDPVPGRTLYNFRPGAALNKTFGLFHVTDDRLDVAFGTVGSGGAVTWNLGWSGAITNQPLRLLQGTWQTNIDTPGFVDANLVSVPDGWVVEGLFLFQRQVQLADIYTLSPGLICRDQNGALQKVMNADPTTGNYFSGGRTKTDAPYFHTELVNCPLGMSIVGLGLFQYRQNRVAVQLVCQPDTGGDTVVVRPQGWGSSYFPSQGYAETGPVGPDNDEVRSVGLYEEGNRVSFQAWVTA